ncbi:MAG: antibiotic biosynthesis monooxygenase [Planctomycetota bacterium]|jgi:quinol monooxygenase YgiN
MAHMLAVNLKVANYEKWKACFDASTEMRKAAGEQSYQLFHKAEDPNDLVMLCVWHDEESARKFLASDDLRAAQQESGVTQHPDCSVLVELDSRTL